MSKTGLLISYGLRDASKSRVVLTLIVTSLSIAFAAVLASSSVLEGFKAILINGAIGTSGHLIITSDKKGEKTIENVPDLVDKLKAMNNVAAVSVRTHAAMSMKYGDLTVAVAAGYGVNPVDEAAVTGFKKNIQQGTFLNGTSTSTKEVVLGLSVADALVGTAFDKKLAKVGDTIDVSFFTGKKETFKIVGITDAKGFMGNLMTFMDKQDLETLDASEKDSEIGVKLTDPAKMDGTKKAIEDLGYPIKVITWREQAGYVDDLTSVISSITSMISRLLIVSIFVIISIIVFINVFQKRRQIGIMKSMGANNSFIIGIYMFETLLYAILSYIIGFLIYMLMYLYSNDHPLATLIGDFSLVFNQDNVISTSIILLIAAVAGSFIPSYIAAKTRIIEVLSSNV